jgi:hypothetical protein
MRLAPLVFTVPLLAACAGSVGSGAMNDDTSAALTTVEPSPTLQKIDALYSNPSDWETVEADAYALLATYGLDGPTAPACATFFSYALLDLGGITIPDEKYQGVDIRINTTGLSKYLEGSLGWSYLASHKQLDLGDAVFTRPATTGSTHPAHVYMFNGWIDDQYAWVIDNQSDKYCDPTNVSFVGFCDADGGGSDHCCRAEGARQWKRSVTADVAYSDPDGTPDTDQRMWFGLRDGS